MRHQRRSTGACSSSHCDRAPARPGHAILDFLHLLGGMDVNRPAFGERNDRREFVRCHGAQAVRRDADIGAGQARDGLARGGHQFGELIDRADEAALAVMRRGAAEGAVRIETRQQRQADAGGFGSLRNARRHLGGVGVGRAVAIMMQIMEFADAGKPALQHLDIEQRRDASDVVRRHRQREAIHRLAPGPERVGACRRAIRQAPPCRAGKRGCAGSPVPEARWRGARRRHAGATPGVTAAIAPAVMTTCTSLAQPEGRSADAKCSRDMLPRRLDRTAPRLYV